MLFRIGVRFHLRFCLLSSSILNHDPSRVYHCNVESRVRARAISELSSMERNGGWGTNHGMDTGIGWSAILLFLSSSIPISRYFASLLFFPSFCDRFSFSFSAHAFFFSVLSPCGFSLCSASCVLSEGGCGMGGGGGKREERFVAYITTLEVIFPVLFFFSSNASYFPFFFYICFVRQCGGFVCV